VVAPGAIETDFGGGHVRDNTEVNKQIAGLTALGRVGLPDDIGGVIALLVQPENGWINGQRIEVSGGIYSRPRRRKRDRFPLNPRLFPRAVHPAPATMRTGTLREAERG